MDVKTKMQNIVLSITFKGAEFNLRKLAKLLDGAVYDRFPGLVYKSVNPPVSFLIFASGKMICAGARNMGDANRAVEALTEKLRSAHINVGGAPKIEVQNMVASIDFGKRFDLERIAWNFDNTEYEPEVFPGLVFRVEDPKAVVLIFVSGKGICAGVKSMRDVKRAARKTGKILQGYISK
jgi:transcription initiation factor TFIID TATA-box-binding protein